MVKGLTYRCDRVAMGLVVALYLLLVVLDVVLLGDVTLLARGLVFTVIVLYPLAYGWFSLINMAHKEWVEKNQESWKCALAKAFVVLAVMFIVILIY